MATYKQVGYGSRGSDVTKLQELLNQNGSYNLQTDGIFGDKTKAAVTDYQKKNGLAVDGIVGENTWGALTKAQTTNTTPSQSAETVTPTPAMPEVTSPTFSPFSYDEYKPSETVAQAEALLKQQMSNKPGSYQSSWQAQLNDIIGNIQNRDKFSYDVNGDALYQQYKDQYVQQGKLAMMDTMGQAAALTGGYGSSYGQAVGQQAYQGYLQQLNEVVPELYGMALDQYNQEGQALYDQAALLAQMEDQDYGRYRDQMSDYYAELDRRTEDARYQSEQDYGRYMDGYNIAYGQYMDQVEQDYARYMDQYNMAYGQYRDQIADQQWQSQFDESKRQYDQEYEFAMQQYRDSQSNGGGSTSGGTPSSGNNGGNEEPKDNVYDTNGYTEEQIKALQAAAGITVDGIWGPDTEKAYQNGYRPDTDPVDDTPTYESIVNDLNTYIRNGADKSQINNYIRSAYYDGYITQDQYDHLKANFAPRNYTYR